MRIHKTIPVKCHFWHVEFSNFQFPKCYIELEHLWNHIGAQHLENSQKTLTRIQRILTNKQALTMFPLEVANKSIFHLFFFQSFSSHWKYWKTSEWIPHKQFYKYPSTNCWRTWLPHPPLCQCEIQWMQIAYFYHLWIKKKCMIIATNKFLIHWLN